MTFFRRNVFNLDNLYHFLFLLYQHFCSLQHKPVFLHTVFGLYFTWSIYLVHKIHKKIDSAQSNSWSFVNEQIKMYHQINFLQLINYILNLVTQVDDALLFYEICIFSVKIPSVYFCFSPFAKTFRQTQLY